MEVEAIAQLEYLVAGHLLDLVGRVATFEAWPQRPSFDGLTQNDRRSATTEVFGGCLVGGKQFLVVVATTGQISEFVV